MITFKNASLNDFDVAFDYIKKLWTYNTYKKTTVLDVYKRVICSPDNFAFFIMDEGQYKGFCHGTYFDTFWMSGRTCYVSSIITNEGERKKGYGTLLMNHAKELAIAQKCKALILDSGFPRTEAHQFYDTYGFEKSCYGFELLL